MALAALVDFRKNVDLPHLLSPPLIHGGGKLIMHVSLELRMGQILLDDVLVSGLPVCVAVELGRWNLVVAGLPTRRSGPNRLLSTILFCSACSPCLIWSALDFGLCCSALPFLHHPL